MGAEVTDVSLITGMLHGRPPGAGTINLIVVTNYRFTHEAMLRAIQIVTEAKVKVLIVRPSPLLVERLEIVSGLIYRAATETDRAD